MVGGLSISNDELPDSMVQRRSKIIEHFPDLNRVFDRGKGVVTLDHPDLSIGFLAVHDTVALLFDERRKFRAQ